MRERTVKPDKAIEEIRAVRHKISAEHGHDTRRLVRHYQEMEKRYADRIVREPARPGSADEPTRNLRRRDVMAWVETDPIQHQTWGKITIEACPAPPDGRPGRTINFRARWDGGDVCWELEISDQQAGNMADFQDPEWPDKEWLGVFLRIGTQRFRDQILPTLPHAHTGSWPRPIRRVRHEEIWPTRTRRP